MEYDTEGAGEQVEECGFYEGYSLQRFVIISAASAVSFFGIIANCVLLAIFVRQLPNSLYSAVLALLDALLCLVYLLLFGVDAGFVYLHIEALFIIYHAYMIPVFILSRIVQFAMPYMLILATFERFVWTAGHKMRTQLAKFCSRRGRLISVIVTISTSICLRIPIAYAMEVKSFPNCSDLFRSMSVSPTAWAADSEAYYVFDLHVMSLAQTFLPFIVLLVLNSFIVYRLLRTKKEQIYAALKLSRFMRNPNKSEVSSKRASQSNTAQSATLRENFVLIELTSQVMLKSLGSRRKNRKKKQLRCAVYTMVAIVCTYLISNSLHLMLTALERSATKILVDDSDPNVSSNFYIAFSDTVSFCYMFTSAIRIVIYALCNPTLRLQIANFLRGNTQHIVAEVSEDDGTSLNKSPTMSR